MKIQNQMPIGPQDAATRKAKLEEQMHGAANMYEQHFLDEMVKAMRSTVHHEDGFIKPNMAENIFSEQLDHQYVEGWANKGGIGLADMIYSQLHEQIFPNKKDFSHPQGPLPLKNSAPMQIKVEKKGPEAGRIFFHSQNDQPLVQPSQVTNPWDGRVESSGTSDGWTHLTILHDNQIRSALAFQGTGSELKVGDRLEAGRAVGSMAPGTATLRWDVKLA